MEGTRLQVEWPNWFSTASLDVADDVKGLHHQDFIYNDKKLFNLLDSPVRVLQLRGDVALLKHMSMVYNKFSEDQHGLKLEDTTSKDCHNWASAQRLCQGKVQYGLHVFIHYLKCIKNIHVGWKNIWRFVLTIKISFYLFVWMSDHI